MYSVWREGLVFTVWFFDDCYNNFDSSFMDYSLDSTICFENIEKCFIC